MTHTAVWFWFCVGNTKYGCVCPVTLGRKTRYSMSLLHLTFWKACLVQLRLYAFLDKTLPVFLQKEMDKRMGLG